MKTMRYNDIRDKKAAKDMGTSNAWRQRQEGSKEMKTSEREEGNKDTKISQARRQQSHHRQEQNKDVIH